MSREISIFLDTNILQTFLGNKTGSNVFLNSLGIRSQFHELTSFIAENRLERLVELCIPEVVVLEMKHHMTTGFSRQCQKLEADLSAHKKVFDAIFDQSAVDLKYDRESYRTYVDSLLEDFFRTPKNLAKLVPFPRSGSVLEALVGKALAGTPPFFSGAIGGKTHSDAGFKDAMIAETICAYSQEYGRLCVYVSRDHDFIQGFDKAIQPDSEFVLFPSIEAAIPALAEYYETDFGAKRVREFTESTYWHEFLLEQAGARLDDSVTDCRVESVSRLEDDVFGIRMVFVVNEANYVFQIKFDSGVNDILGLEYHIEND